MKFAYFLFCVLMLFTVLPSAAMVPFDVYCDRFEAAISSFDAELEDFFTFVPKVTSGVRGILKSDVPLPRVLQAVLDKHSSTMVGALTGMTSLLPHLNQSARSRMASYRGKLIERLYFQQLALDVAVLFVVASPSRKTRSEQAALFAEFASAFGKQLGFVRAQVNVIRRPFAVLCFEQLQAVSTCGNLLRQAAELCGVKRICGELFDQLNVLYSFISKEVRSEISDELDRRIKWSY